MLLSQERNRCPPPVVDEDIHQAVFVQVSGQAAHGRRGGRIKRKGGRMQSEGLVAWRCPGYRRDDYLVRFGVHVAHVVGQAVSVEVVLRNGGPNGRDPRRETL